MISGIVTIATKVTEPLIEAVRNDNRWYTSETVPRFKENLFRNKTVFTKELMQTHYQALSRGYNKQPPEPAVMILTRYILKHCVFPQVFIF